MNESNDKLLQFSNNYFIYNKFSIMIGSPQALFGKGRGLSIHGKVTIIEAFLLLKMIYPSSVLTTPPEIIKEFNTLVFHFLWNDKVTRRSTYAPYDSGGINMVDYQNMVKALRLSWLKKE